MFEDVVVATPAATKTSVDDAKFPWAGLLALAMTGFICINTETLPAGLLPQMSAGLGVSTSLAGQLVSAYALGSLLAAIPLTLITRAWPRRTVLLVTVIGFLIFNTITAVSANYPLTLLARFFAGASAGLAWSLIAGYARRMVAPARQGRALAVAMVGTPIALSLGVPMGTWLGTLVGWRSAFGVMSALTLILIGWVLLSVPNYAGQVGRVTLPLRRVLRMRGVGPVLGVVFTWMLAHNLLYTYIAPFVAEAGLAAHVGLILLIFGMAALVGIAITGRLVERHLRSVTLASLGSFATVALMFALWGKYPLVVYAGMAAWGVTFGGAATLLQTALADSAGDAADVALSLNVVVWNSAIAGAGALGGLLLKHWDVTIFPWAMLLFLLMAIWIARCSRTRGFAAGARTHSQ